MAANADRVAIIGAGHVGATAAYALMLRALFREIVLIDSDSALAEAEAADLSDANALARPAGIWAGTYADAGSAGIAVITAGAATHGDETRLSVAARSAAIVEQCVKQLIDVGFDGILLIAANPVDLMTVIALRVSGLPAERVIGTGTLLDTSRLKQTLSEQMDIAPASIHALVLGEHGDSEFVAFSTIHIGGQAQAQIAAADRERIAKQVREAGYRILGGKGYTSYGVATAIVRICEAIRRDERVILPVSTWLDGEFGVSDLCLSLPCIIGARGIERIVLPDLTGEEIAAFRASAEVVRTVLATLGDA